MRIGNQEPTVEERKERKERKRIQNRRNQQARRDRIRCQGASSEKNTTRQFHVQRWRLDEGIGGTDAMSPKNQIGGACHPQAGVTLPPASGTIERLNASDATADPGHCPISVDTPLSSDHLLLHLVTYNVCRGITSNKAALEVLTSTIQVMMRPSVHRSATTPCDFAVRHAINSNLPSSLLPTQLQTHEPHPTWMDFLPFPEIRDNLIQEQLRFDHMLFLQDLVGDPSYLRPPRLQATEPTAACSSTCPWENGLILWGEPHLRDSWEATPQFLAKWAWAFKGCREIYDSTDRWRISRGEDPLSAVSPHAIICL